MRMQRNFYEVLGVHQNASQQEIKDKYLNLARLYHPDRAKDKQVADRLFVQINRAYSTLRNPEKRALYDVTLFAIAPGINRPPTASSQSPNSSASAQSSSGTAGRQYTPPPPQPTPHQAKELFDQASRLQLQGQLAAALDLAQKALAIDPGNLPGQMLTADLLGQSGKELEAIAIYEGVLRFQPANRVARDKMVRLQGIVGKRTTMPGSVSQTPSQSKPPTAPARPVPKPAAPEQKSFLNKLINRK